MGSVVKLYVYDISRGMASQLAPVLLGRPLDGVWHTGVLVFGNEYFFGAGGISYCPPGGTILGHPTEVVDLGATEIPVDTFHEYLLQLGNDVFNGDRYHLLHHNCNNFSNEVAQFLTGRSIPEKIVNLPEEVMNTPLGQLIRPFIDAMTSEMNAGTHIGRAASSSGGSASANNQNNAGNSNKSKKDTNDDLDLD